MEKEAFSECLQWLQNVTQDSIKDIETFSETFNIEPKTKTNETKLIKVRKKKEENKSEEDISYIVSGDIDSSGYSEDEKEYLYMDNFLDEGTIFSSSIFF
jgi:hypothetical protein